MFGQARALRAAIAEGTEHLAPRYFAGCEALNKVGWSVMETLDLKHASTTGIRPADIEDRWSMAAAIRTLAETDNEAAVASTLGGQSQISSMPHRVG
jgi:hypothetical protein